MGMLYGLPTVNKAVRQPGAIVPIIINGDVAYSGAPPKDEDAQYPMSNLYYPERYRVWSTKVGNADSANNLHIDLSGGANGAGQGSADKAVSSVALLGIRGLLGPPDGQWPAVSNVGYRTRAQGYSSNPSLYTNVASSANTESARDFIWQFTQVSGRYWQLQFSYGQEGFTLGSLWIGVLSDVGIFWSADGGATWAEEHNVLLSRTAGGHMSAVARGDAGARYTLTFRAIDNTKRTTLNADFGAARRGQPILILDENSIARQFFVIDGPTFSQLFNALYDATIELERLG